MTTNYYLDASVVSEQRRDRLEAAETKLMLQQSGVSQRGWLVRQMCALVCGTGRLMIAVGEMLVVRTKGSIAASVARAADDPGSRHQVATFRSKLQRGRSVSVAAEQRAAEWR